MKPGKKINIPQRENCWAQIEKFNPGRFGAAYAKLRYRVKGFRASFGVTEVFVYEEPRGRWTVCEARTGVRVLSRDSRTEALDAFEEGLSNTPNFHATVAGEPDVMLLPEITAEEAHRLLGV